MSTTTRLRIEAKKEKNWLYPAGRESSMILPRGIQRTYTTARGSDRRHHAKPQARQNQTKLHRHHDAPTQFQHRSRRAETSGTRAREHTSRHWCGAPCNTSRSSKPGLAPAGQNPNAHSQETHVYKFCSMSSGSSVYQSVVGASHVEHACPWSRSMNTLLESCLDALERRSWILSQWVNRGRRLRS